MQTDLWFSTQGFPTPPLHYPYDIIKVQFVNFLVVFFIDIILIFKTILCFPTSFQFVCSICNLETMLIFISLELIKGKMADFTLEGIRAGMHNPKRELVGLSAVLLYFKHLQNFCLTCTWSLFHLLPIFFFLWVWKNNLL